MSLAAERGWAGFALEDVARRSRMKLAEVTKICPDKNVLLALLNEEADAAMLADDVGEGTVRDRLFELFMRRFDALARWKPGVVAVVRTQDVLLPFAVRGALRNSMRQMLEAAGIGSDILREAALGIVAASVLKTWCDDESADCSKTMSVLDTRLGQLERAAEALAPLCGGKNR